MANLTGSNLGAGARDGGRMAESQDVTSQRVNFPEGWILTKLESLTTDISYGYTASSSLEVVGPKMLRITDIQDNSVDWSDVPYCEIEEDKLEKYLLKKNDLVFARTGATVGKSFLLRTEPSKAVYASYLIRVRTASEDLISVLSHFFNSQQYWQQITEFSAGIGQPNVNGTKLKGLTIPLPPLAEQKVIADKLDTLLAQVETTKARLERIPQILKTFRQSVLAAAVSGKLTEEWRQENEISIERWVSTNIGALAQVATGKTPKRTNAEYWDGGDIPWLTSAATGAALTFEADQFVTKLAVKECTLKLFPVGTLLLAMYGEGKTRGQVTELQLEATCNQACAAILVDEMKVSKEFLKLRLQENYEETRKAAVGGAQPNLNLNKVREITVDLPSESEQTEIVRRVEELFAFADSIEQKANAALERVNNLTQSILAKAFRGELTADWRAANPELISGDNSAVALLEAIHKERKAEREAMKLKKKTRARKKA
jgi:type I restriction enzyme S subunit